MKKKNFICPFIILIFMISLFPSIAYADMGPKDKLTVHVQNPPDELYYLDLLTQGTSKYDNLSSDKREALNQDMVKLLYSYENEGWKPAFVEGTGRPMWGDLTGTPNNGERVHTFGYVGLPDTYRIIIVTKSGTVSVSDTFKRKALQSSITYNYATKKAATPNLAVAYILQFLTTCIPTLVIEGIILLLLGFSLKKNWKVFLLVNIITQLFLTVTVGISLIKSGTVSTYIIQFPIELIILIAETIAFKKLLKGQSQKRCIAYGIAANLASWGFGMFLLRYQFDFLSKII